MINLKTNMDIQVDRVVDSGTHNSELVEISVINNCNLQYYMVADTTYIDANSISNKMRHMHWFLNNPVNAGDKVFLYTKTGINRTEALPNGKTLHIIYWGLNNSVWNNTGDAALLFKIQNWKTTKVK